MMQTRTYPVRFLTPAFLGNAEQDGQWRTPPFKALIRHWWRVAYAADGGFRVDPKAMRAAEGELFGQAAGGEGQKSQVRIRLDRWDQGTLTRWGGDPKVRHDEVGKDGAMVGAHLYLGYGPLNFNQGTFLGKKAGGGFKPHAAIQAGEAARLRLAYPESESRLLETALYLMDAFGTLGGRSRNGWGSFTLQGEQPPLPPAMPLPQRPWEEALQLDWPHALGTDETGPLVWQTAVAPDWQQLMKRLAEVKIGLRTEFRFSNGGTPNPEPRHWLSYPVTHHPVKEWKKRNLRLPNSLRFKVRETAENHLVGLIFHVPCSPPAEFRPDPKAVKETWRRVHRYLDGQDLKRVPA